MSDLHRLAQLAPSAWGLLCTHGKYRRPAHVALFEKLALDVEAGRTLRAMVQVGPRMGKSVYFSRAFASWFLGRHPDARVAIVSYGEELAAGHARVARDWLAEHGPRTFGVRVSRASAAATRWDIEGRDGGMIAAGAGGPLVGRGFDLVILDDLNKNLEEAASKTQQEKLLDWYRGTLRSRLEPGARIVLAQHRWHVQDLPGRLMDEATKGGESWTVLRLPTLSEGEGDPLGRPVNVPLWPERFSADEVEGARRGAGSVLFSAQHQQAPLNLDGNLFRREWMSRRYAIAGRSVILDGPPVALESLRVFATVDLAVTTKSSSDWTVVLVAGLAPDGRLVVLEVFRARLEGPDLVPAIGRITDAWRCSAVFVEKVAFQTMVIQEAARAGLPVREFKPEGDKFTRAVPVTSWLESGRLWLPKVAPWLEEFESELLAFDRGAHDDQVDALSAAVKVAADELRPPSDPGQASFAARRDIDAVFDPEAAAAGSDHDENEAPSGTHGGAFGHAAFVGSAHRGFDEDN